MSFDKAISHGKEHRKPYHGAKAIDPSCRNHGSDDWATGNRLHKHKKRKDAMTEKEAEDGNLQDGSDILLD